MDDFNESLDDFVTPPDNQEEEIIEDVLETPTEEILDTQQEEEGDESPDIIAELLKTKGIQDSSKIKIQNDEGEIVEMKWEDLSIEDQLGILNHTDTTSESDLEDDEIELLNTIRSSKMTPAEYIQYIQKISVDNYVNNTNTPSYKVDDISDDELYLMDILHKVGDENITDEELQKALDSAKSDEVLYKKQVDAIRREYKSLEDSKRQEEQELVLKQQKEQYDQFTNQIGQSIVNFKEFEGFELNMSRDDQEELYEFITGFDQAGNSIFSKALNDPNLLVQMAWFALNGKQMVEDITDYFTNEISNVRKNSYQKGVEDGRNGKVKDNTVYRKPKNNKSSFSSDLIDEDFV